jgi:hypothetical protein
MLALGTVFGGAGAWALWRAWTARRWPSVPGKVVTVDVRWSGVMARGAHPVIRYEYAVGGVVREGSRLGLGAEVGRASERSARAAAGNLAPGDPVTVFYNPRRPDDAALRPGASVADIVLLVIGVVVLGAALGA